MQSSTERAEYAYYEQRFAHLRSISQHAEASAGQYLLAVNGGGAAAMLAFIGAVPGYRAAGFSYVVLGAFVLGLVLVGVAHAHANIHINRALHKWNQDMILYMEKKLEWQEMVRRDHERTNFTVTPWICGYGALALFLFGLAAAVWLFVKTVPYVPV